MIADIDKEGSGVIDFEEFLGMMATKRAPATNCALTALTRRLPAGWASATRARRFSRPSACSTTTRRRVLMRRAGRKSGRARRKPSAPAPVLPDLASCAAEQADARGAGSAACACSALLRAYLQRRAVQGKISFKNLKRVAKELGENMTDEELQEMIDEADRDGDGEVSEEEFIKCVLTLLAPGAPASLTHASLIHSGLCERRPFSVPTEGMRRRELRQTDEMMRTANPSSASCSSSTGDAAACTASTPVNSPPMAAACGWGIRLMFSRGAEQKTINGRSQTTDRYCSA